MAEIGLLASIVGIAGAATELSMGLYRFADRMRQSRPEATILANEVSLLGWSLDELAGSFKKASRISKTASRTARELIYSCQMLINEVSDSLKQSSLDKIGGAAFWASVKWPFKRERLDYLRGHLESLKTTLLVLLGSIKLKNANDVRRLKQDRQSLKEEVDSLKMRLTCLLRTHEAAAATLLQSAAQEFAQEAVNDSDDPSSETRVTDESVAANLSQLALTPIRSGEYDGRLLLTRNVSELRIGRRNVDLLPQIMAFRFAELVLENVDPTEEEEKVEINKSDAEGADERTGLKESVTLSAIDAIGKAIYDRVRSKSRRQVRSDSSWSDNEDYQVHNQHNSSAAATNLDTEQDEAADLTRRTPRRSLHTSHPKSSASSKERERARNDPWAYRSEEDQGKPKFLAYGGGKPYSLENVNFGTRQIGKEQMRSDEDDLGQAPAFKFRISAPPLNRSTTQPARYVMKGRSQERVASDPQDKRRKRKAKKKEVTRSVFV